jgi:dethiobiotin synthetase
MMKPLPKDIFVTGIDTNVGKTIVSAILVEALKADYWKPIQSGNIEGTDAHTVQNLISNSYSKIHPEAYSLKAPTVPSYAADLEGVKVEPLQIGLPPTANRLIVEGAGGLMVHLTGDFMVVDLIQQLDIPVVLVSKNYLGSINHTLLSIEAMRHRGIDILGIIYNGEPSTHMRQLIYDTSGIPEIGSIGAAADLNKGFIRDQSALLFSSLSKHFIIS